MLKFDTIVTSSKFSTVKRACVPTGLLTLQISTPFSLKYTFMAVL